MAIYEAPAFTVDEFDEVGFWPAFYYAAVAACGVSVSVIAFICSVRPGECYTLSSTIAAVRNYLYG